MKNPATSLIRLFTLSLLGSHFVQMPEAAGRDHHEREEQEVVAGVDEDARGERPREEAHCAQNEAYANEQEEWAERITGLFGMHPRKGNTGGD